MKSIKVKGKTALVGKFSVPGDKSISHRAITIGSIAEGETRIKGLSKGEDCRATLNAFKSLGVQIQEGEILTICGKGPYGLKENKKVIDAGNSGTTARLILGILSGQPFKTFITGDESLKRRPMKRVSEPLRKMGARIEGEDDANFLPLSVEGGSLHALRHVSPIASAQVKSALLLAGLYASGKTAVTEPSLSRDHTERMLLSFGANINSSMEEKNVYGKAPAFQQITHSIEGGGVLRGKEITIAGDISAASFFIGAALLTPGSMITITGVGINPTRLRMLDILISSGADIRISNETIVGGEPSADISVKASELKPFRIEGTDIPSLLDEIPVLSIIAAFIKGESTIRGASELRMKESDRIAALAINLKKLGADVQELEDGLLVKGGEKLKATELDSFGDHRIAMAMITSAIISGEETVVHNTDCINSSFPEFLDTLNKLCPGVEIIQT